MALPRRLKPHNSLERERGGGAAVLGPVLSQAGHQVRGQHAQHGLRGACGGEGGGAHGRAALFTVNFVRWVVASFCALVEIRRHGAQVSMCL